MKVSKAQAQENRMHIIETASVLFRERGYDGVGVAELMSTAGFTHGGFYKHFSSKADLMSEAVASGFSQSLSNLPNVDSKEFVEEYLSQKHRDSFGKGCTMAALSTDVSRQAEPIKEAFAAGLEAQLAALKSHDDITDDARAKKINMIAHLVGTLVLSRACPKHSELADEILNVCRAQALSQF